VDLSKDFGPSTSGKTIIIASTEGNWSSGNTSVATINAFGLATSVASGTSLINATSDGISSPSQTLRRIRFGL
jgi:hypothetical protein